MNNLEFVIKLMRSALTNENFDINVDLKNKELLMLLKEQTFLPMLYYVSKIDSLKPYYLSSCLFHEELNKIKKNIKSIFDHNQIDHIFLKGSSTKDLYENENIRLLGDIDVLIKEKDLKNAINLLKEKGFKYGERCSHHVSFHYGRIEVELHFAIIEKNIRISKYLTKPFDNCYLIDNHTYQLNPEYNLVFVIAHYMKHLRGGSGLRNFCDIYLLINKYNINLDNVRKIFKKYKYETFFDTLLTCLNIIFNYNKYPFTYNKSAEDLITYSLYSGIHGFGKKNNFIINKQQAHSNNKFVYLLKTLFVPVKQLFDFYPWTKSIILIPFGYIARFFHLIFKRRKQLKTVLNSKQRNNQLFKNIGLK